MSSCDWVVAKVAQICFRTPANASAKVGFTFLYHAVAWQPSACFLTNRWAINATRLNKAKSTGVVRAMAWSFHWRWVSHAQMGAGLFKGGFDCPTLNKKCQHLPRRQAPMSRQQRLRRKGVVRISNEGAIESARAASRCDTTRRFGNRPPRCAACGHTTEGWLGFAKAYPGRPDGVEGRVNGSLCSGGDPLGGRTEAEPGYTGPHPDADASRLVT